MSQKDRKLNLTECQGLSPSEPAILRKHLKFASPKTAFRSCRRDSPQKSSAERHQAIGAQRVYFRQPGVCAEPPRWRASLRGGWSCGKAGPKTGARALTDMWKAAGADPQQAPAKWRGLPGTKAFVDHVEVTIGKSDSELFLAVNGGRSPGTWAHWQIGLAYAKYLSPEFHMWCNTVVRERMEGARAPEALTASQVGGIVKAVQHRGLAEHMGPLVAALQAVLAGVVADYQPMLTVLVEQHVGPRKRPSNSARCLSRPSEPIVKTTDTEATMRQQGLGHIGYNHD